MKTSPSLWKVPDIPNDNEHALSCRSCQEIGSLHDKKLFYFYMMLFLHTSYFEFSQIMDFGLAPWGPLIYQITLLSYLRAPHFSRRRNHNTTIRVGVWGFSFTAMKVSLLFPHLYDVGVAIPSDPHRINSIWTDIIT